MTPKADYIGMTARGEVAYDLRDITVQIVENVPVNRGLPSSTTALDAAQRAQEILASPNFTTFGVMNPVSIEQGEDSGLIVCQAKFNCNVHARYINPKTTKVKYTAASGLPDWEGDIVGELTDASIPNKSNIAEVEIGSHVTSIGEYAFSDNGNLTNVAIPSSVTSIGYGAFYNCSGLTSVTIGDGVESIGNEAFYGCRGLTSVAIPDSVTYIGESAFAGCSGLTAVHITDLAKWCGISFNNATANPLIYAHNLYLNGVKITNLEIPDGVTSIESYTFSGCSGLTSVTIPDSVTSIGEYAFSECVGLAGVTIGNGVTSIGNEAFYSCSGLTSVIIPDSVMSIESYAFDGCSGLTSVTIGNGAESIGEGAFYGCSSLTSVTFSGKEKETVQGMENYSWELDSGCVLHCTDGDITI